MDRRHWGWIISFSHEIHLSRLICAYVRKESHAIDLSLTLLSVYIQFRSLQICLDDNDNDDDGEEEIHNSKWILMMMIDCECVYRIIERKRETHRYVCLDALKIDQRPIQFQLDDCCSTVHPYRLSITLMSFTEPWIIIFDLSIEQMVLLMHTHTQTHSDEKIRMWISTGKREKLMIEHNLFRRSSNKQKRKMSMSQ